MIRNSIFAIATLAVAATTSITGAKAGVYDIGSGDHYGNRNSYQECHWERQKVFIGYDSYGHRKFKWKRIKICG